MFQNYLMLESVLLFILPMQIFLHHWIKLNLKDTTMDAPGAQVQPAMPKPGAPTAPRMIPLVRQVVPQPIVPIAMNRPTPMAVPVRPVALIRGNHKV